MYLSKANCTLVHGDPSPSFLSCVALNLVIPPAGLALLQLGTAQLTDHQLCITEEPKRPAMTRPGTESGPETGPGKPLLDS